MSVRGVFAVVGSLLLPAAHAFAAGTPPLPVCKGWSARTNHMEAYTIGVPLEGYLLLPIELKQGTSTSGPLPTPTELPTIEVRDESGELVPGAAEMFDSWVGSYDELGALNLLFRGDAGFTPGTRYEVRAVADNLDNCSVGDLDFGFEFTVDVRTLEERLASAFSELGAPSLGWRRREFTPECCQARSNALCPTGEPCFACMKTSLELDVVFAHEPATLSPYLAYSTQYSAEPGGTPIDEADFTALDAEFRLHASLCQTQYCARATVESPITGESLSTDEVCVPGSEPVIEPPDSGAELFPGNPCADGSGPGDWRSSDPPACWQYPELSWFESEAEGIVALGGVWPDAGTGPPDMSDDVPRVERSGCALAARGANAFSLGVVLCSLAALARRARSAHRTITPTEGRSPKGSALRWDRNFPPRAR